MHFLSGQGGTVFLSPIMSSITAPDTTEQGQDVAIAPLACTMTSIVVRSDSPVSGDAAVYTLRVGTNVTAPATSDLADTALSCTMGGGTQFCSATAPPIAINANALFDVSATPIGDPLPPPSNVVVALVCQ